MIKDNGATNKQDELSSKVVQFPDPIQSIAIGMDLMKIVPALNGILQELQHLKHENREMKEFVSKSISEVGGSESWMDTGGLKKHLANPCNNTFRDYINGKYGSPIPCHKVGNRLLFKPREVDDWVKTWEISKELSQF